MFLLFFLLWLLLSGGISVHTCLWGVAVSAADLLVLQAGAGLSVAGVLRQSFQNLGHGAVFCSPAGGDAEGRTGNHADHLHPPQGHRTQAGVVPHPAEDRPPQGNAGRLDHAHRGDNHRAAEDGRMLVHTLDTPLAEGIEDSSFQQRLERMEAAQWNK